MKNTKSSQKKFQGTHSQVKKTDLKNGKKKKQNLSSRLPKDYPWQVLNALKEDLASSCTPNFIEDLSLIIRNRDIDSYMKLGQEWCLQSINASCDLPIGVIRSHYQLASLLKKFPFEGNKKLQKESAIKKFIISEIDCNSYNRFGKFLLNSNDPFSRNVKLYARGWIEKILGFELPEFDFWTLRSRHGPGASTSTVNRLTSKYFKYSELPYHCTVRARGYAIAAIKSDQRWSNALCNWYREKYNIPSYQNVMHEDFWNEVLLVVPGNRIAFVPKTYQTDRTIAVEPTMNLYLQLGVDGFIRKRLKNWDIDLDSQSKNCELARQGSLCDNDDSFVTIDLSAASDSISTLLVREMLPEAWYNLLMDLRSPVGELEGKKIRYAKISSMGNGYTFALESLIFASIVYGVYKTQFGEVNPKEFAIYGDDIIVKKGCVERVIQHLQMFGFKLNLDKTFLQGPIRESCGADWFKGKPLRPVMLNTFPRDPKDLFCDYNRLKRIKSLRFGTGESVENLILKWIPFKLKNFFGPFSDEEFDTYLHSPIPQGKWVNSCWKIPRLLRIPCIFRESEVNAFDFRKLMHNLSSYSETKSFWKKGEITTGNNFDVVNPKGYRIKQTNSASSIWESEYTENHTPFAGSMITGSP